MSHRHTCGHLKADHNIFRNEYDVYTASGNVIGRVTGDSRESASEQAHSLPTLKPLQQFWIEPVHHCDIKACKNYCDSACGKDCGCTGCSN